MGTIEKMQGPLTCLVRLDSGQLWRQHVDHVRQISEPSMETTQTNVTTDDAEMLGVPLLDSSDTTDVPEASPDGSVTAPAASSTVDLAPPTDTSQRRYPLRVRKPNPRYTDWFYFKLL